ncbi:MAG TPA: MipA/OmpV family protein [Kiritimatiellia bacterium]|nr:MipA/OmpV family protein [Kiritimatiellia bacterium]HMP00615.1 MipA/OmpV family protein [Kiritimatiellia bacterium]
MKTQPWKRIFCLLACMFMVSLNAYSESEPATILVRGDFPILGSLEVKMFQSLEDFFRRQAVREVRVAVTGAVMAVHLPAFPEGDYLISVSHDANNDGRMNANAFGVPTERSAFYQPNAAGGPVRARDAFFPIPTDGAPLEVALTPPPADPRAWGAGAMVLLSSNPYRGGDVVVRGLPLLTYVGENLFIVGPRGGYNLVRNRWINANLAAEFKFAGEAFEEEKFLAGMAKRRDTVMAGVDAGLRALGPWRVESSALTDVLGRHDGQEVTLSLGRNYRGKTWSLTPAAGAVWRSSNYNNYYFGVRGNEATPDRPAYQPGASVEPFIRLFSRLELSGAWSLLGSVRLEVLSDDVRDSPIIDKDVLTTAFIGINYAF